jgi:ankyrin repeat protein
LSFTAEFSISESFYHIVSPCAFHKVDVEAKNRNGTTALSKAAAIGDEVTVRLLLEHKADVGAWNSLGRTALHQAAGKGCEAVVRLLLECKAKG